MQSKDVINSKYFSGFFCSSDGDKPPEVCLPEPVKKAYKRLLRPIPSFAEWQPLEVKTLESSYKKAKKIHSNSTNLPQFWDDVSSSVPGRSPESCRAKYLDSCAKKKKKTKFTKDEISALSSVFKAESLKQEEFSWEAVASKFNRTMKSRLRSDVAVNYENRTAWQCLKAVVENNISKEANSEARKAIWTEEENELLKKGYMIFGDNYMEISELMKTRDIDQIYMRWERNLSPEVLKSKGRRWKKDEIERLKKIVTCYSSCDPIPWTFVARHIDGRPPHQCRERNVHNHNPLGRHKATKEQDSEKSLEE